MSNMRDLINKLTEIEESPAKGDGFFLEFADRIEVETEILEITEDGDLIILGDDKLISLLEDLNNFEKQKLEEEFDILNAIPWLITKNPLTAGISTFFQTLLIPDNGYPYGDTMSPPDRAFNDAISSGKSHDEAVQVWNAVNDEMQRQVKLGGKFNDATGQFEPPPNTIPPDTGVGRADTPVSSNKAPVAKTIDKSDANAISKIPQFDSVKHAYDTIANAVGNAFSSERIAQLAKIAKDYALPGLAIAAMLYGGKKLYDYINSPEAKKKQAVAEQQNYDKSHGGPYDRGSADAYYGRPPRPHKIVPYTGPDAVQGQMQKVTLTDPEEIAAYNAGYSEEDDRKDWGESLTNEAKYHGRTVPLGKPMKGDVKKSKVYVRNPKTGKVIKVNFGDKNMRIKKSNPKRRKSFRARHNCANPGPRTKARYWSCRKW